MYNNVYITLELCQLENSSVTAADTGQYKMKIKDNIAVNTQYP